MNDIKLKEKYVAYVYTEVNRIAQIGKKVWSYKSDRIMKARHNAHNTYAKNNIMSLSEERALFLTDIVSTDSNSYYFLEIQSILGASFEEWKREYLILKLAGVK